MLWTAHQVAEALALPSARCFHARRRRLEGEHGFPPPVAGLPDRWDPRAIEAWLAAQRPRLAAVNDDDGAEAVLIARARRMAPR